MRCRNCGYEMPQGSLHCKRCGEEVRIVPDYNPLDDMLTAQIKVSINDEEQASVRHTRKNPNTASHKTMSEREAREARRRQAERRRELKRKKRRQLLILMASVLGVIVGISILIYQTSYTGVVKKGNKALVSAEYANAIEYFEKAISKKPEQPDAYEGLSKTYVAKGDLEIAESVFQDAIEKYPDNIEIHESFIMFYLDTEQAMEIPKLLKNSSKKVKEKLESFIVSKPEFSLDAGKVYDDVQQLTLISDEDIIYYTLDGSDPTFNSIKYTEPIQLDEGETIVKTISVNKNGVPSLYAEEKYIIELPIEDAPAVSPSTGQYDQSMKIEIKVPEGYTAYYTMDGSTPTTASKKYTGPIDMPENDTLFKAILVNASGRSSGITTRNYILDISEVEE